MSNVRKRKSDDERIRTSRRTSSDVVTTIKNTVHVNSVLNKFISPTYYNSRNEYLLERILELGVTLGAVPASTGVSVLRRMYDVLRREFPQLSLACIVDHVNVIYSRPTEAFFRVANFWNYHKIEGLFNRVIKWGIGGMRIDFEDSRLATRKVAVGFCDRETAKSYATGGMKVAHRVSVFDGTHYSYSDAALGTVANFEKFLNKFAREWPKRGRYVTDVTLFSDGPFFSVLYEDGWLITTLPDAVLSSRFATVYSVAFHVLFDAPVLIVAFEAFLISRLRDAFHVKHYTRHLIFGDRRNHANVVIIDYVKINALMATVRNEREDVVATLFEQIHAAKQDYEAWKATRPRDVVSQWSAIGELVAPVLVPAHNYNFRELKVISYLLVYGLRNDLALVQQMKNAGLPNLYPGADGRYYRVMKELSMARMDLFSQRIDCERQCVCTYSRRPYVADNPFLDRAAASSKPRDVSLPGFAECVPPRHTSVNADGTYLFSKQTIVATVPVAYKIPRCMSSWLPSDSEVVFRSVVVDSREGAWRWVLDARIAHPTFVFVVFKWQEQSNKISVDVQATGKFNLKTRSSLRFCFFVVGAETATLRVLCPVRSDGRAIIHSFLEKRVPVKVKHVVEAAVNKRRSLINATPDSGISWNDPPVLCEVYVTSHGTDASAFGDAVFFSRHRRKSRIAPPYPRTLPPVSSDDLAMTVAVTELQILKFAAERENAIVVSATDPREKQLLDFLADGERSNAETAFLFDWIKSDPKLLSYAMQLAESDLMPLGLGNVLRNLPDEGVVRRTKSDMTEFALVADVCGTLTASANARVGTVDSKHQFPSSSRVRRYASEFSARTIRSTRRDYLVRLAKRNKLTSRNNIGDNYATVRRIVSEHATLGDAFAFVTTAAVGGAVLEASRARETETVTETVTETGTETSPEKARSRKSAEEHPFVYNDVVLIRRSIKELKENLLPRMEVEVEVAKGPAEKGWRLRVKAAEIVKQRRRPDDDDEGDEEDEEEEGEEDDDLNFEVVDPESNCSTTFGQVLGSVDSDDEGEEEEEEAEATGSHKTRSRTKTNKISSLRRSSFKTSFINSYNVIRNAGSQKLGYESSSLLLV